MPSFAILIASLVATANLVGPAQLLNDDVPNGFELAVEGPTELTFEEYAPLSPDATAHVDPAAPGALAMRAAVDVWTSGAEDVLLREVTRWSSPDEAQAFVDQAVVVGSNRDQSLADAPFDGGVAFVVASEGLWTRTVAWRQGTYAMTVSHFALADDSADVIERAATALAASVEDATGLSVDEPAGPVEEPPASTSSGGISIATVLLFLVVVGGVIWTVLRIRRLRARAADRPARRRRGFERDDPPKLDDERVDVDDIIERARARGRAEREIDAIPDPTVANDD